MNEMVLQFPYIWHCIKVSIQRWVWKQWSVFCKEWNRQPFSKKSCLLFCHIDIYLVEPYLLYYTKALQLIAQRCIGRAGECLFAIVRVFYTATTTFPFIFPSSNTMQACLISSKLNSAPNEGLIALSRMNRKMLSMAGCMG